jgi:hypothetical protein
LPNIPKANHGKVRSDIEFPGMTDND